MSSLGKIELIQNSEGHERVYFLPGGPLDKSESSYLDLVGADPVELKSNEAFQLSFDKAESGEYHRILFPQNIVIHDPEFELLHEAQQRGFAVSVWMTPHFFLRLKLKRLQELKELGVSLEVLVVAGEENSLDSVFQRMGEDKLTITFLMTKDLKADEAFQKLSKSKHQLYFYFPTPKEKDPRVLSVQQIKDRLDQLKTKFPQLRLERRSGLDVYDSRISEDRELEPMIPPEIVTAVADSDVALSVIIPSYNNCLYLSVVVKHLTRQDLDPRRYEIILVDDGSDDGTFEHFKDFAQTHEGQFNFKLIYFPRKQARQMGDDQFRASVARNLGVKYADGEIYSFLDSDILVPPNYLSHLIELHKGYEVVQGRRLELLKQKSHSQTEYLEVCPDKDTYAVDHGFWIDFLSDSRPWNDIESGWRYVCTHSLSVRAETFKNVGWFRKTFAFYGYEDSELGYRLWQHGARFKRNDHVVYHLYHADARSEFNNSHLRKLMLLANTAPIFYVNTLDNDVYDKLKYLFDDFFRLKSLLYPVVQPVKKMLSQGFYIFLATLWMLSFFVKRILAAGLRFVLSPWNLLTKHRLRTQFHEQLPKGLRGRILNCRNWNQFNKPLSLLRFYYLERDDELQGDFLQSVMRATNGHYDGIVFPESLLDLEDAHEILEFAKSKISHVVVEVNQSRLSDPSARLKIEALATDFAVHLIVDKYDDVIIPEIHRLLSFDHALLVLNLTRWIGAAGFLEALGSEYWSQVTLRSRPQTVEIEKSMHADQIFDQLYFLKRYCPEFIIQPEPGKPLHAFDKERPCMEMVSSYEVGTSEAPRIRLSVIVHHAESHIGLETVLNHLKSQDLSQDHLEIIWVSDGVEEERAAKELAYFMNHCESINFKMIHIPKSEDQPLETVESRREFSYFVGAEEARGEVLSFVTSETVWRKNTASDLLEKHRGYDVVQSQFFQAPREAAHAQAETWSPNQLKEIALSQFLDPSDYDVGQSELTEAWTVVGTQGVSVKRESYFWVGGLRPSYFGTGFAFLELAQRFYQAGASIYLNSRLFSQYFIGKSHDDVRRYALSSGARMLYSETLSPAVHAKTLTVGSFFRTPKSTSNFVSDLGQELRGWVDGFISILLFFTQDLAISWKLARSKSTDFRINGLERLYYRWIHPIYFKAKYLPDHANSLFSKVYIFWVKYMPGTTRMYFARLFYPIVYFFIHLPGKFYPLVNLIQFKILHPMRGLARFAYTKSRTGLVKVGLTLVWMKSYSVIGTKHVLVYLSVRSKHMFRITNFLIQRELKYSVLRVQRLVRAVFWKLFALLHPFRKAYYFCRFQWEKRFKKPIPPKVAGRSS